MVAGLRSECEWAPLFGGAVGLGGERSRLLIRYADGQALSAIDFTIDGAGQSNRCGAWNFLKSLSDGLFEGGELEW